MMSGILAVDVGGTFTDLAFWDGDRLRVGKVVSTPDQADGVIAGASEVAGGSAVDHFVHGTTVATNTLLERKGARTALVTTAGFGDVLEIGRQNRPSLYDSFADRPDPLVPAPLRFEVAGRTGADGSEEQALGDLEALAETLRAAAPEAVAIALLYSFAAGHHEQMVLDALGPQLPDASMSVSSEVVPEFREFERISTTILNAYLMPETGRYLARLAARAREAGLPSDLSVMRSSGGLIGLTRAAQLPAAVLLSGPAGGAVASAELGRAHGYDHVISFDMGGTSTDVCRIDFGRPQVSFERAVEGFPCRMPAISINTVGAGGGSISWLDPGDALRVGPHSAGAFPGPACYPRGGEDATVTDAHTALGRLRPAGGLAGTVPLDEDAARRALGRVGARVGLDVEDVARGILSVVEAHMARAIRRVSVEEGADPRSSMLVAFGGAGGLHATALARDLEMAGVIVPPFAGVFSAIGLLLSPPRADLARTVLLDANSAQGLDSVVVEAQSAAAAELAARGHGGLAVRSSVDTRYLGQSHETSVPYEPGQGWERLEAAFHDAHLKRNGFARPGDPIEAVTVRAEATAPSPLQWSDLGGFTPVGTAKRGTRPVLTSDGPVDAAVWWRFGLEPGREVIGPAVVEETEATTYVAPGEKAEVHESGALRVEW